MVRWGPSHTDTSKYIFKTNPSIYPVKIILCLPRADGSKTISAITVIFRSVKFVMYWVRSESSRTGSAKYGHAVWICIVTISLKIPDIVASRYI